MRLIELKSCPRCRGDMVLEEWLGQAELVCLQCGHRADAVAQRRQQGPAPPAMPKEAVPAAA